MVMPTNMIELERVKAECVTLVNKRAAASGLVSAVPIPGIDIAADVSMLLELMRKINIRFGLTPEQVEELDDFSKQIVFGVIKQSGKFAIQKGIEILGEKAAKQALARVVTNQIAKQAGKQLGKFIPIIGQIAAAGIGFSAMKMAGQNHIDECYEIVKEVIEGKTQRKPEDEVVNPSTREVAI